MLKRFLMMAMVPAIITFAYGCATGEGAMSGVMLLLLSFGFLAPLYGALFLIALFVTIYKSESGKDRKDTKQFLIK